MMYKSRPDPASPFVGRIQPNHKFARDEHGIRTIIPANHGRPTLKLPAGRYRRLMKVRFVRPAYRRRSQVETVISMIKRRKGAHVHARFYHGQCRELRLLVLTHNIMILVVVVGHHGAINGTTQPLVVNAITPKIAVLDVGHWDDGRGSGGIYNTYAYGHPRRGILEMLGGSMTGSRSHPMNPMAGLGNHHFVPYTVRETLT